MTTSNNKTKKAISTTPPEMIQISTGAWYPKKECTEISCEKEGCTNTRIVHNPDLYQTKLCVECTEAKKKAARSAKSKAKTAEKNAIRTKADLAAKVKNNPEEVLALLKELGLELPAPAPKKASSK